MLKAKVLDFICQKVLEIKCHFLLESTCRLQLPGLMGEKPDSPKINYFFATEETGKALISTGQAY